MVASELLDQLEAIHRAQMLLVARIPDFTQVLKKVRIGHHVSNSLVRDD